MAQAELHRFEQGICEERIQRDAEVQQKKQYNGRWSKTVPPSRSLDTPTPQIRVPAAVRR